MLAFLSQSFATQRQFDVRLTLTFTNKRAPCVSAVFELYPAAIAALADLIHSSSLR